MGGLKMAKECLWYNGELGNYELLDFDPNGLSNKEVADKAWIFLKDKYLFEREDKRKVLETLYLIEVSNLERVI